MTSSKQHTHNETCVDAAACVHMCVPACAYMCVCICVHLVGFHLTLYVFGLGMVSWGMAAELAAGLGLGQQ